MSRLYIENINDEIIIEDKQFHYLVNVMKKKQGDELFVFDGKSGEYIFEISEVFKKYIKAKMLKKTKEFAPCLDVWLLFAPIKKEATDFVIEKATELGVKKIIPVITKRVNNHNFKTSRARLQVIESAEQCERLDIPEVFEPVKLSDVLSKWDENRSLCPLLERENADNVFEVFSNLKSDKIAIMVGPEGGFSAEEKEMLKKYIPISMGQRILRAETACVAALSCYQAIKGDFR